MPYLDPLRWVLIAVALGGIAVTIYARLDDWTPGAAMIASLLTRFAASLQMRMDLRYGTIAITVLLFLFALRRSGERGGRLAERLKTKEKANDVQRQMLEAAARRPRSRDDLVERLRDGQF